MNQPIEPAIDRHSASVARSNLYALFARASRCPDSGWPTGGVLCDQIEEAFATAFPSQSAPFRHAEAPYLHIASLQDLEAEFINAFETDVPSPAVSLYESSYYPGSRPQLLLELKQFYRAFGLTIALSDNGLEDALAAELEFMQFLTAKQAQAEWGEIEDRGPYVRAQRDFLERHLAAWLPGLVATAQAKLKSRFYLELTALVADFVDRDLALIRADPIFMRDDGASAAGNVLHVSL